MKKKNITIDNLAVMVQKGFQETTSHIDERFNEVNKRLNSLENGQEEIKLKLDNVAYRFELVELQKRVEFLEKKTGIKK